MGERSKARSRRSFTVSVMGETVTLNESTMWGCLLLPDPEPGWVKVRATWAGC